jgi:ribosomal protein S18 acetylase RimI-like enzyme
MLIRRATEANWPLLWPIWREVVAAGDTYVWAPETTEDDARDVWMLPRPAETWLAEIDGVVVGTYQLKPNAPSLGSHVANAGFMVATAARRNGVGRALAEHCLDRARSLGYEAMQFNAVVETNASAIALWESLGFRIVGTVPAAHRPPAKGDLSVHIMYRQL